ncbi:hypothetical protein ABC347_10930 [Sphingomonas sp. 1P06PA]|uniref:hypothetical protein n=1 Tax=Sphingomonas sp. 1P06PA TaxID=554121 RepID=UPI0039A4B674
MADPTIRPLNAAILVKLETTEGIDAVPVAADAIPFEGDYSYNYPFGSETSNEVVGGLVTGAPLIVGQAAQLTINFRLKGAGPSAVYTASVKPPHHAIYAMAGKRPQFTAAVSAQALTAGTTSSATLGASFPATAQALRGMPLILSGGPAAGRWPLVTDYTAGRVATLADTFGSALGTTDQAALPANWLYAGTSPADAAARLTDHPSATVYIYEDGTLLKFVGCRATLSLAAQAARAGIVTATITGTFAGQSDASIPAAAIGAAHAAPTLNMGAGGINPAFLVNRAGLPISSFTIDDSGAIESPEDPNTPYGFGSGVIGQRSPQLTMDPLKTTIATRDALAQLSAGSIFPAGVRFGSVVGNRIGIVLPQATPASLEAGTRGALRSENQTLRALNPGRDSLGRDGDWTLCFY